MFLILVSGRSIDFAWKMNGVMNVIRSDQIRVIPTVIRICPGDHDPESDPNLPGSVENMLSIFNRFSLF
jgi:uncharacterized Zn-finger protein